ncbi:MAG: O-antigen ligase family protein [Gulosibacter sp.]|uniref:O-antigen ligase family protein n=1 Tax=Gulosibacter sp. TaxID=2817531 RepID=UPI003F9252F2
MTNPSQLRSSQPNTQPATGPALAARTASPTSKALIAIINIATFGPYLSANIRTEQLAVYGFVLLLTPLILRRSVPSMGLAFMLPWIAYVLISLVGIAAPTRVSAAFASGSVLAGLDNVLLPLVIMLLIWAAIPIDDAESMFLLVLKIVAVAMAFNGALAIMSTWLELSPILQPFWGGSGEFYVAANSEQMGRYTGIFNQPAEAGALYGIAGLATVYAWRHRMLWQLLLITLISLGGLLSVSKIFVLGALPIVLIYWIWSQRGHRKLTLLVGLVTMIFTILMSGILANWTGAEYLGRLFETQDGGLLDLYSAGRFTEDSMFNTVVAEALRVNPISGVGASGWQAPYDGFIAEALVVGGIVGLLCQLAVLAGLFWLSWRLAGRERIFAFLFAVLTVGAGLGFAPLTANRVSTISWLIIALLVLIAQKRAAGTAHAAGTATRTDPSAHPEI